VLRHAPPDEPANNRRNDMTIEQITAAVDAGKRVVTFENNLVGYVRGGRVAGGATGYLVYYYNHNKKVVKVVGLFDNSLDLSTFVLQ
jgi:hypothetical protein